MSHVLQRHHLAAYSLHGEFSAWDRAVLGVVRAVCASVHAVVGQVQRGKHYDALAVDLLLELTSKGEYPFPMLC